MNNAGNLILIVDDTRENADILASVLCEYGRTRVAYDGLEALHMIKKEKPSLVLLDIMLPVIDGYTVCKKILEGEEGDKTSVIFLTGRQDLESQEYGLSLGAVDYITKPMAMGIVRSRVRRHLELIDYREELERKVERKTAALMMRTEELEMTRSATLESLSALAERRDNDTGNHIKRTKKYARLIAKSLAVTDKFHWQLDDETIARIENAAPLHDIGKVGIPDSILLKNGPLTPEEKVIMQKHTVYAKNALDQAIGMLGKNSAFLQVAKIIAYSHHERWDGLGYPQGLKGENIPLPARIMTLADIYDALRTKRPYKEIIPHQETMNIIREEKGKIFDPAIVESFLEIEWEFEKISEIYKDE